MVSREKHQWFSLFELERKIIWGYYYRGSQTIIAVVNLIGLLINSSFDKSNESIESSDGIVADSQSDMQIVLRNEIESQIMTVGKLAYLMSDIDPNSCEKGKTVIRLKGVKIIKHDFPL